MEKTLFHLIGGISDDLIAEAAFPQKKARRIRISKIAVLAAAIILLLSLTAWAGTVTLSQRSSRSMNIPDYTSAPSPQTLQKDIGISPRIAERFANGYTFRSGIIVHNEDFDENGGISEAFRSLTCDYRRGSEQFILCIDGSAAGHGMDEEETADVYKNCELKYFAYRNKLVPPDYKLTAQDEADKASGTYVFSYGSKEIEIKEVQLLAWKQNGPNYEICTVDNTMAVEELIQMARELIDYQQK